MVRVCHHRGGTFDDKAHAKKEETDDVTINVADVERWAPAIGGAALTAYGIKQLKDRSP